MRPIFVMATIPATTELSELGAKGEWPIRLGFASEEDMNAYRRKWSVPPHFLCSVVKISAAERGLAASLANLIRGHLRARGL